MQNTEELKEFIKVCKFKIEKATDIKPFNDVISNVMQQLQNRHEFCANITRLKRIIKDNTTIKHKKFLVLNELDLMIGNH